ncbi:unnamed protein product [Leuciscus chuanchicus]
MTSSGIFYKKSIKTRSPFLPTKCRLFPRATGHKATEKRRITSSDQTSLSSPPSQAAAQQGDDRIFSALLAIQGSLSNMDNRIQALESQRSASAHRVMFDGQTSSSTSDCAFTLDPATNLPRRTLGSALPAASTGAPFFPPAAAISPQLRAHILSERFNSRHLRFGARTGLMHGFLAGLSYLPTFSFTCQNLSKTHRP